MKLAATSVTLLAFAALLGCERPPVEVEQVGYRGTGMEQVVNPRRQARLDAMQDVPEPLPQASPAGPKAGDLYDNVRVLEDLSVSQFTRLMQSITNWVSPEQGCVYCHAPGEPLSSDSLYTKVVSRRMLEMTLHINDQWVDHVGATGVTCYTCHRGKNVPEYGWFLDPAAGAAPSMVGYTAGQNRPAPSVGLASLPYDPFSDLLAAQGEIRVIPNQALPTDEYGASIKATEHTYALMMHMSDSLGVNCTYCHNSRAFGEWAQSRGPRTPAWYGIRMVRALNNEYLDPLAPVFPDKRLGPQGDVQKANCTTCHQGAVKPLGGAAMLEDHPELTARN